MLLNKTHSLCLCNTSMQFAYFTTPGGDVGRYVTRCYSLVCGAYIKDCIARVLSHSQHTNVVEQRTQTVARPRYAADVRLGQRT